MRRNIFDLIISDSMDYLPCEMENELSHRVCKVADLFGFTYLYDDLKIKLYICEKVDFEKKREGTSLENSDEIIAFQNDINKIYVMKYEYLEEQYSREDYIAVIVHEIIHVLQFYFSKVLPKEYVWLYESIACYLANQKPKCNCFEIGPWEIFKNDFYSMKNCYNVAFEFGATIFRVYPDKVLHIIKYPDVYDEVLAEIYNSQLLG